MRNIAFLVAGAAMLVGSVRGDPDFSGQCSVGGVRMPYFGTLTGSQGITNADECMDWCMRDIEVISYSPLRGVSYNSGSTNQCFCSIDQDALTGAGTYQFSSTTTRVSGTPDSGSGNPSWECYIVAEAPPCDINVVVGIDQTSMKRGDSLQAFTDKLFELTDELTIGPDDVWMEVAYLQGHKQKGNQDKKQITIALENADSQANVVDPRDFVTETELIPRPRTPWLAFLDVLVPQFVIDTNPARPSYCLLFTNKGDIARGKDKKALRKFAKEFRADPPCTPVCYQDSPQAKGPSFLARVLCADELSFYSDTYDATALKTAMCAVP